MAAMMRQKRKQILTISRRSALGLGLAALLVPWRAQAAGLVTTIVADPLTGAAIDGFDPVSYFLEEDPVPGNPEISHVWGGVPWYFASAANRDVFKRHPEIYAPQFGGHCAMSLSRGFLSDGKPQLHLRYKAKLYLFYSVANREAFAEIRPAAAERAALRWQEVSQDLVGEEASVAAALGGVRL